MKLLQRGVLILFCLLVSVYAGDYAAVRIRNRAAFSTVVVRPYYDVVLKSGKSDLYFLDPQRQTCVNSLFPHMGYSPCWYLRKHTHPKISM